MDEAPIKGAPAREAVDLSLEQLIRRRSVFRHIVNMLLDAADFLPERFDSKLQFVDRQGAEVLLDQLVQRVARFRGKKIVEIHGQQS
jgi:hypothetical protein